MTILDQTTDFAQKPKVLGSYYKTLKVQFGDRNDVHGLYGIFVEDV